MFFFSRSPASSDRKRCLYERPCFFLYIFPRASSFFPVCFFSPLFTLEVIHRTQNWLVHIPRGFPRRVSSINHLLASASDHNAGDHSSGRGETRTFRLPKGSGSLAVFPRKCPFFPRRLRYRLLSEKFAPALCPVPSRATPKNTSPHVLEISEGSPSFLPFRSELATDSEARCTFPAECSDGVY